MNNCRAQRHVLFSIGCLGILFLGCVKKDARFEIHGRVTYESDSIAEGKILFLPVDESRPQAIAQIVDGEYKTDASGGVFPGEYKVQVFGYRGTGKVQDLGPLHGEQEQQVQYVPAKYNDLTELTAQMSSDKSEYNFDLQ